MAGVRVYVADPRSLTRTWTETAGLKQLLQRQGRAAVAGDAGVARIGARARSFQPHLLSAWAAGSGASPTAKALVNNATPISVLQMYVFATTDEADRRRFSTLAIIAAMLKAFRGFEILETGESAPVWGVSADRIACEPAGEYGRLDPGR